ncbi:MAG: Nif3-like dinuclear metal center hexameric protein [Cyclobacteriaceae bacterium]
MKIKTIISLLEKWAPPAYQESYDNSGLLIGDKHADCTGCLITLDTIESVIDEAIEKGCNLIVSHHPIIFGGLKKITGRNYVERTVLKAIKNDIAVYAIHTNLDNVHTGVNRKICDLIGLSSPKILAPKSNVLKKLTVFVPTSAAESVQNALFDSGAGSIGNYKECSFSTTGTGTFRPGQKSNPTIGTAGGEREAVEEQKIEFLINGHETQLILARLFESHPYEEVAYFLTDLDNNHREVGSGMVGELEKPVDTLDFLKDLKTKMNISFIRHTAVYKKSVQRIAVCGGAGGFLLSAAKTAGADLFITSDYKYHEFFDADSQIVIADIGHYESEAFTKELIYDFFTENLVNIAFYSSKVNTNPINYL